MNNPCVILQYSPVDNDVDIVIGPFSSWDAAQNYIDDLNSGEEDHGEFQIQWLTSPED